ncbi:MAG TPA: DUF2619 domain-containing protein [Virgibacillus sp.]|nr:DUF2619 domain-containing protein [Virgibacillus sp.]
MFSIIERTVVVMALFRLFSGSLEIFAAFLMMRLNDIEKSLIVNISLAVIGPFILIITTTNEFHNYNKQPFQYSM